MEFNARDAYDALVSARSAPAGEAAGVDVVQLARDVVLAEQEFRRAGEYFSGGAAESEGRERGLSDWAKGLGWGVLAAASVTPWGSLGRLGRAARLGQDVFEGTRNVARSAEVAGRWDVPEGVDDLTRSMMEFQREAGVPFGEALEAANRTRAAEGFEPIAAARATGPDYGNLVILAGSTDEDVTRRAFNGAYSGDLSWFPEEMKRDYGIDVTENDALALIDELRAEARFPYERRGITEVYVWRAGHRFDGKYDEPVSVWDARDVNFEEVTPSRAVAPGDDFGEPVLYKVPISAVEAEGRETGELLVNPDFLEPVGDVARTVPGRWSENPTAELVPTGWLGRFAEFERSGEGVDALATDIAARGFDDPLILEVGLNGRASLIEGNNRLAAAQRLGLESVPVRVVTARNVERASGGEAAPVALRGGLGAGKLLRPSEAIEDIPLVGDVARGAEAVVLPGSVDEIVRLGAESVPSGSRTGYDVEYDPTKNIDMEAVDVEERISEGIAGAQYRISLEDSPRGELARATVDEGSFYSFPDFEPTADWRFFIAGSEAVPTVWDFNGARIMPVAESSGKFVVRAVNNVFFDEPYYRTHIPGRINPSQLYQRSLPFVEKDPAAVMLGFPSNDGVTDGDEFRFLVGTLAQSRDEAFSLAASRGQVYVYDAATGQQVRVPEEFYGRNPLYPGNPGRNVISEVATDANDAAAYTGYAGRGEADEVLDRIYAAQGFDEPTEIISADYAERLRAMGFIPLYRGVDMSRMPEISDAVSRFVLLDSRVMRNRDFDEHRRLLEALDVETNYRHEFAEIAPMSTDGPRGATFRSWLKTWVRFKAGLIPNPDGAEVTAQFDDALRRIYGSDVIDDFLREIPSPTSYVETFARGDYWPGVGSHGSGTYMTPNIGRAQGYAANRPSGVGINNLTTHDINGVVVGAMLSPAARIMGPSEYNALAAAVQTGDWQRMRVDGRRWSIPEELRGAFKPVERARMNERGPDDVGQIAQELDILDQPAIEFNQMLDSLPEGMEALEMRPTFSDMGRLIASLGYDGYIPPRSVYGYHKPEYVILNRKVLKVMERPVNPFYHRIGRTPDDPSVTTEVPIW